MAKAKAKIAIRGTSGRRSTYGVWIEGCGWLRIRNGGITGAWDSFRDTAKQLAEHAKECPECQNSPVIATTGHHIESVFA